MGRLLARLSCLGLADIKPRKGHASLQQCAELTPHGLAETALAYAKTYAKAKKRNAQCRSGAPDGMGLGDERGNRGSRWQLTQGEARSMVDTLGEDWTEVYARLDRGEAGLDDTTGCAGCLLGGKFRIGENRFFFSVGLIFFLKKGGFYYTSVLTPEEESFVGRLTRSSSSSLRVSVGSPEKRAVQRRLGSTGRHEPRR